MKKLKLDTDALAVSSFTAGPWQEPGARGTLRGHEAGPPASIPCLTGTETYTCPTSVRTCLCAIGG